MTTQTQSRIFIVHTDPGHGWIEASREEVNKLGLARQISSWSYQSKNGQTLYLEEDCDMSLYLNALGYNSKEKRPYFDYRHEENTFIRSLPHYRV